MLTCGYCGKEIKTGKYCSCHCAGMVNNARPRKKHKIALTCYFCGRCFFRKSSEVRGRYFCERSCWLEWRRSEEGRRLSSLYSAKGKNG